MAASILFTRATSKLLSLKQLAKRFAETAKSLLENLVTKDPLTAKDATQHVKVLSQDSTVQEETH